MIVEIKVINFDFNYQLKIVDNVICFFDLLPNDDEPALSQTGIVITFIFTDKSLVCCSTAWDDFEKIVNNLGGPMEIKRTEELKKMIRILPDDLEGENLHFCISTRN